MIILTIRTDKPEAEIGLFEIDSLQSSRLDGVQGADEQRSETYKQYDERAAQPATQQSAKSTDRVSSSAAEQASTARRIAYEKWQAHRQLSETIHSKIEKLLKSQKKDWTDIKGIVCYKGPGSFTGLRIGLSVANALAASLEVPIVGTTSADWQRLGISDLKSGKNEHVVLPEYGSPVHITLPKR